MTLVQTLNQLAHSNLTPDQWTVVGLVVALFLLSVLMTLIAWGRQLTDDITILTLKARIRDKTFENEIWENEATRLQINNEAFQRTNRMLREDRDADTVRLANANETNKALVQELKTLKQRYNLNGSAPRDKNGRFVKPFTPTK